MSVKRKLKFHFALCRALRYYPDSVFKEQSANCWIMAWMQQLQSVDRGQAFVCVLMAYALGCCTMGYYLVRAKTGRDIREVDSGSVGARNVGRVLGKSGFFITLLGDLGKGALAVWVSWHFTGNNLIAGLAMLAVVTGHIWPVQLRFHGGKGASTSLAGLLVLDYHLVFAFVAFFLVAFAMTRKMTLPGLFAFACLPVATFWLTRDGLAFIIVVILVTMVLFAHRKNMVEEIPALAARRGVETKPGQPKI